MPTRGKGRAYKKGSKKRNQRKVKVDGERHGSGPKTRGSPKRGMLILKQLCKSGGEERRQKKTQHIKSQFYDVPFKGKRTAGAC